MTEDPLVRMHREYREQCIRQGTYRPVTQGELDRGIARWKAECSRPPRKVRKRKHQPKGTAD